MGSQEGMVSGHIRQRLAGRCRLCDAVGMCMLKVWVGRSSSDGARVVIGYALRLEGVPLCIRVQREVRAMAV